MTTMLYRYPHAMYTRSTNSLFYFFFNDTATTEIYTLSLHDALPIYRRPSTTSITRSRSSNASSRGSSNLTVPPPPVPRSEEHTSELQSPCNLVCRLLLEKKKTA